MLQNDPRRAERYLITRRAARARSILLVGASSLAVALALAAPQHALARPWSAGGGGGAVQAPSVAVDAASAAAQQAAAIAKRSQESMAAAAAALNAMRAAQAAARQAAQGLSSPVPNGLAPGGLVVDPRVLSGLNPNLWLNATLPTQTRVNNKQLVTVQQTAPRAVTSWQHFNVGADTTVHFDQSQGNSAAGNNWVMLSRIAATGSPSQIRGQIKAEGTVLLINPNGIIFNGGSQINVGSLIATSHDIDSSLAASAFASGRNYIKPPNFDFYVPPSEATANAAFVDNGLYSIPDSGKGGANSLVLSLGDLSGTPNRNPGSIIVMPGASINTGVNATSGNAGYAALIGAQVYNSGAIATPGGQTILAATNQAQLIAPSPGDIGVNRRIRVLTPQTAETIFSRAPIEWQSIQQLVSLDGSAILINYANALIEADNGNVTLIGDKVTHAGAISAKTSITRPGSITINALAGDVNLREGSLLSILPDENGGSIPTVSLLDDPNLFGNAIQPRIDIGSKQNVVVHGFDGVTRGALIKAPGANVTMTAGAPFGVNSQPSPGTVLLESGSAIDLSGLAGVSAPLSQYIIDILVTQAEVADNPLSSALIGQRVTIDARASGQRADGRGLWFGSPILNARGYIGTIPKTIDQLLTVGGTFTATAGDNAQLGNVVQKPGSVIDVSGGSINYAGGLVRTSRLIGADGRIYDIAEADPSISYLGVAGRFKVEHPRWQGPEYYSNPLVVSGFNQPGYVSGANAGAVTLRANAPVLAGTVHADIVNGPRQRAGSELLSRGAALAIDFLGPIAEVPKVVLQTAASGPNPLNIDALNPATASTWRPTLDANNEFPIFTNLLTSTGYRSIDIKGQNELRMASGATLSVLAGTGGASPNAGVTLGNVTSIEGAIVAHGGKIELTGVNGAQQGRSEDPKDFYLGSTAVLDVSGLWINDTGANNESLQGSAFINGGSVIIKTPAAGRLSTVTSLIESGTVDGRDAVNGVIVSSKDVTQSIVLAPGSLIDLSSGGYVGLNGRLKYGADGLPLGNGGNLTLQVYAGGFSPFVDKLDYGGGLFHLTGQASGVQLRDGTRIADGSIVSICQGSFCGEGFDARTDIAPTDGVLRANLALGGTIHAAGFSGGGTLNLGAPSIKIAKGDGPVASYFGALPTSIASGFPAPGMHNLGTAGAVALAATAANPHGDLVLPASFFNGNEFGSYILTSTSGDISVAPGAAVTLRQANLLQQDATQGPSVILPPSGVSARQHFGLGLAADGLRKSVDLMLFDANGLDGLVLSEGASISADSRASGPSASASSPETRRCWPSAKSSRLQARSISSARTQIKATTRTR